MCCFGTFSNNSRYLNRNTQLIRAQLVIERNLQKYYTSGDIASRDHFVDKYGLQASRHIRMSTFLIRAFGAAISCNGFNGFEFIGQTSVDATDFVFLASNLVDSTNSSDTIGANGDLQIPHRMCHDWTTGAILGQLVGIVPTIIAVGVGLGRSVGSVERFEVVTQGGAIHASLLQSQAKGASKL
ncbi:hypothetical protein B0H16DRAFT_1460512 [Mycena metata]|uniref:Uncharacterized protein n=1 Tax=Mycena metata TaxID=1033252 RepID=A0AAD7N831_9AGAR|nr:hypothetical protein B0H16DRAFT_1460512 [Mycena metata]